MNPTWLMTCRLHAGAAALGLDARQAVLDRRCPDGGFRGRRGGSSLWYTDFAVRALDLCGGAPPGVLDGVRDWLPTLPPPARPVDCLGQNSLRRRLRLRQLSPTRLYRSVLSPPHPKPSGSSALSARDRDGGGRSADVEHGRVFAQQVQMPEYPENDSLFFLNR